MKNKTWIKWIALVAFLVGLVFGLWTKMAHAQSGASLWKLSGTTLQSINSTWGLKVPGINGTGTTRCLNINSAGLFGVAAADCGTGGGGGSGDFIGPASSTDNAVVRFDTTTGKLGQNSIFTIDDSGNADGLVSLDIDASGALSFGGTNIISDVAGITTLANIDGINSTTENTLEAALDLGGDVTSTGLNSVTIANDAVTYAKMQNISATDKILGRSSAGSGDTQEITFSDSAQDFSQDTFADDQVWVADSATAGTARTLPNCTDTSGNHLNYTQSTNSFSCGTTSSGGGSTAWDTIGDPSGNGSIAMAETTQSLDWDTKGVTAAAFDGLTFSIQDDAATDILTQRLLTLENKAASTQTVEVLQRLLNSDAVAVTTGLLVDGNAFTTAIDLSDADIVTALSAGANDLSGTNWSITGSDGTFTFPTLTLSGTGTLNGLDVIDATSETTIETAIDTLANLTSVQGQTLTLAGSFITSGANSLTLTTTGATNVTLPTTGTLATLAGTETLSNKTLTQPKFADLGYIADANGNEILILDTQGSAVNEFTVLNNITGAAPRISATGGDTNISIDLYPKGTGRVRDSGVNIPTISSTDTLSNKTLTYASNVIDYCTDPIWFGDQYSDLTTGTNKGYYTIPGNQAFTVTSVNGRLITAATGGTLVTIDINEAGTSILSTKMTFDASEKTSTTAATAPVISDSSIAADAEITVDIDAVGNTTPGNGGYVQLCGTL